jgi:hypothetical protein
MRFKNIELENLDTDLGNGGYEGNFVIPATDELIEITNKIRERQGNTDLVGVKYENDVYYTHYLSFNADKKEITLQASVANGEKDDYVWYNIELLPEEKEMLMWKVIKELLNNII